MSDFSEMWEDFGEQIPNEATIAALEEAEQMRLSPSISTRNTDISKLLRILKERNNYDKS